MRLLREKIDNISVQTIYRWKCRFIGLLNNAVVRFEIEVGVSEKFAEIPNFTIFASDILWYRKLAAYRKIEHRWIYKHSSIQPYQNRYLF